MRTSTSMGRGTSMGSGANAGATADHAAWLDGRSIRAYLFFDRVFFFGFLLSVFPFFLSSLPLLSCMSIVPV